MRRLFLFLVLMLFGSVLLSGAFAVYNDEGNDSCLTIYSDSRVYRPNFLKRPGVIEVYLTVENNCGSSMNANIGLLTEKRHKTKVALIDVEVLNLGVKEKITNGLTLDVLGFVSEKKFFETKIGWENYFLKDGNSEILLTLSVPKEDGEFVVTVFNLLEPAQRSILDPTYSGSGTIGDPYVITDCVELQDVNAHTNDATVYFELGNNIDCTETKNWLGVGEVMKGFEPIGTQAAPFKGHFDGKNFTITNLTVYNVVTQGTGLFASLNGADVNNLGLFDVNIFSNDARAGGLAGDSVGYTSIHTVYIRGGNVTGLQYTGGLIGIGNSGDSNQVYTKDLNVNNGAAADIGGLFGYTGGTLKDCYSTALITSTGANAGALVGRTAGSAVSSYWNPTDSGVAVSALGTELTQANMYKEAQYVGWNFADFWLIVEDVNTPYWEDGGPPYVAPTPDLNLTTINGLSYLSNPVFTFAFDGNITIDFNVFLSDNNRLMVDLNYSPTRAQGTGMVIVEDLNLDSSICPDLDWNDVSSACSFVWNYFGVDDGNYFVNGFLKVPISGNSDFNASDANFAIANDVNLVIRVPIDEETFEVIDVNTYSFRVSYSDGNNVYIYSDLVAPIYLSVPVGTLLTFEIDENTSNYFGRGYYLRYDVATASDILQPYLVKKATVGGSGIQSVLFTRSENNKAVPDIEIRAYRIVPNSGNTLMEQLVTDAAGSATFAFVQGAEYSLNFLRDGNVFSSGVILRPVYSSYQFYLSAEVFNVPDENGVIFDVNFFPDMGFIDSAVWADVNLNIEVSNAIISDLNILIYLDDNTLYNVVVGVDGFYELPVVSIVGAPGSSILNVEVILTTSSGLRLSRSKAYSFNLSVTQLGLNEFFDDLPGLINFNRHSEHLEVSTLCCLLLTIFICGALKRKAQVDMGGTALFALLLMGVFTFMGLVYFPAFVVACIICFGLMIFVRSF